MIVPAILAAGESKRFGSQKLIYPYKGKPLLQWTIDTVSALKAKGFVVISENVDLSLINFKTLKVLVNKRVDLGLSESVKIALLEAKGKDGIMIFLGDMPKISLNLAEKVFEMAGEKIVFPIYNKVKGFPVYIPSKYFDEAMKIEGDKGLRDLLISKSDIMTFEWGEECIFDVDFLKDVEGTCSDEFQVRGS